MFFSSLSIWVLCGWALLGPLKISKVKISEIKIVYEREWLMNEDKKSPNILRMADCVSFVVNLPMCGTFSFASNSRHNGVIAYERSGAV